MSKTWRYSLSIICLCILLALLWRSPETEELINTLSYNNQTSPTEYPSSIIEGAKTVQFNTLGNIEYQLTTQKALYFEQSDLNPQAYIEYQNPELIFYGDDTNTPTIVAAETALSRDNGDTLLLENNVLLKQTLDTGEQYTLTTDALTILPNQQFARTDKPVIINAPSGKTTATGLTADFKQQRIELLSDVRGNYVQ